MTLQEQLDKLQTERDEYVAKAEALLGENEGLTEEQEAEAKELAKAIDEIDVQVKALHADRERRLNVATELQSRRDAPQLTLRPDPPPNVPAAALHIGSTNLTIPRSQRRVRVRNFKNDEGGDGYTAQEKAYRFGMWAQAAISVANPRLRNREAEAFVEADPYMVLTTGNDGGSLIPDEFSSDLIVLRETYGAARRAFRVWPMRSETLTVPRETGQVTTYYTNDDTDITESDDSFDDVELVARNLSAITRVAAAVMEDSPIAVGDHIARTIGWAMAKAEDDAGFIGDGTSTYGGITGVTTALNALTAGTAPGLTLGAGSASWSALTLANFETVLGSLPQYADTPNAAWICHKTFWATVMLRLELAAGGASATEIRDGVRTPRFLGYPVLISQSYPSAAAASHVPVTFGDHAMGAAFGDRETLEVAFSTEANVGSVSLWTRNQVGIRGTQRYDIVVHDVGTDSVAGPIVGLETGA